MSNIPRTHLQRRRAAEFWACLVIFGGSLFVMGWLTGEATAAETCNRIYPAPPVLMVDRIGQTHYAQPVGVPYVRCLLKNPCTLEQSCQSSARQAEAVVRRAS